MEVEVEIEIDVAIGIVEESASYSYAMKYGTHTQVHRMIALARHLTSLYHCCHCCCWCWLPLLLLLLLLLLYYTFLQSTSSLLGFCFCFSSARNTHENMKKLVQTTRQRGISECVSGWVNCGWWVVVWVESI